jgi:hypothetical protein
MWYHFSATTDCCHRKVIEVKESLDKHKKIFFPSLAPLSSCTLPFDILEKKNYINFLWQPYKALWTAFFLFHITIKAWVIKSRWRTMALNGFIKTPLDKYVWEVGCIGVRKGKLCVHNVICVWASDQIPIVIFPIIRCC